LQQESMSSGQFHYCSWFSRCVQEQVHTSLSIHEPGPAS
jgi:hypothetical protein